MKVNPDDNQINLGKIQRAEAGFDKMQQSQQQVSTAAVKNQIATGLSSICDISINASTAPSQATKVNSLGDATPTTPIEWQIYGWGQLSKLMLVLTKMQSQQGSYSQKYIDQFNSICANWVNIHQAYQKLGISPNDNLCYDHIVDALGNISIAIQQGTVATDSINSILTLWTNSPSSGGDSPASQEVSFAQSSDVTNYFQSIDATSLNGQQACFNYFLIFAGLAGSGNQALIPDGYAFFNSTTGQGDIFTNLTAFVGYYLKETDPDNWASDYSNFASILPTIPDPAPSGSGDYATMLNSFQSATTEIQNGWPTSISTDPNIYNNWGRTDNGQWISYDPQTGDTTLPSEFAQGIQAFITNPS